MTIYEFMQRARELKVKRHEESAAPILRAVTWKLFSVSIQASQHHYCTPRGDFHPSNYTHVELGCPSKKVEVWMEFAEDQANPCDTVYGYVPITLVEMVLDKKGGISWPLSILIDSIQNCRYYCELYTRRLKTKWNHQNIKLTFMRKLRKLRKLLS